MTQTIVLTSIKNADFRKMKMPMIVIYNSPLDFPGKYVARIWEAATATPTNCMILKTTLEEIREDINEAGFTMLFQRAAGDAKEIVESWM